MTMRGRANTDVRFTVLFAGFVAGGLSTIVMSVVVGGAESPLVWLGIPTLTGMLVAFVLMLWCSAPHGRRWNTSRGRGEASEGVPAAVVVPRPAVAVSGR